MSEVVGGGSNAEYLNQVTAKHTGRTVYAGSGKATAICWYKCSTIRNSGTEKRQERV